MITHINETLPLLREVRRGNCRETFSDLSLEALGLGGSKSDHERDEFRLDGGLVGLGDLDLLLVIPKSLDSVLEIQTGGLADEHVGLLGTNELEDQGQEASLRLALPELLLGRSTCGGVGRDGVGEALGDGAECLWVGLHF